MMFTKIKNICRYYWLLPEKGEGKEEEREEGREVRVLELGNISERMEQVCFHPLLVSV